MINLEFLPDLQHLLNSAKVEERKASSVNLNSVSMMIFLSVTFYPSITFVLLLSESETAASSFGSGMLSYSLLTTYSCRIESSYMCLVVKENRYLFSTPDGELAKRLREADKKLAELKLLMMKLR